MTPAELAAYDAEIAEHRARREARYRSENGWLTLVDRIHLDEGDNALALGTLRLRGGELTLIVPPGLEVTRADGTRVDGEVAVRSEVDGAAGDRFVHAGLRYEPVRRGDHTSVRVRDPQSPARRAFRGIPAYPTDPRWRVAARFEPLAAGAVVTASWSDGDEAERPVIGAVSFAIGDTACRLVVEREGERLYIAFADPTNRTETYGGGRFLYAPLPDGDRAELDFNRAINLPCAFNSLVVCPLAPPENRLPVRIEAGERLPDFT